MKIFEIFECLCQSLSNSLCQFWNEESIPLKFCIPLQFHERLLLCTFLAKTIYTLLIRSPLKWKSLRLLSARVKFCWIPYANFETTSRLLSKFCISSVSWKIIPLYFYSSKNIYLAQKEPIKMKISECLGQIFSNSLYQFWNEESIFLKFCNPL